jgi:hypothetical protein
MQAAHPGQGLFMEFSGSSLLQRMYNNSNLDFDLVQSTFGNISDSFTNYMRTNGHPNFSVPTTGNVLHYATCLQIQWPWVAFPASLVVLAIAFLLAIATTTPGQQIPYWKASPLAWIFCGPFSNEWNAQGKHSTLSSNATRWMSDQAQGTAVILTKGTEPRVQLVRNQVEDAEATGRPLKTSSYSGN